MFEHQTEISRTRGWILSARRIFHASFLLCIEKGEAVLLTTPPHREQAFKSNLIGYAYANSPAEIDDR